MAMLLPRPVAPGNLLLPCGDQQILVFGPNLIVNWVFSYYSAQLMYKTLFCVPFLIYADYVLCFVYGEANVLMFPTG